MTDKMRSFLKGLALGLAGKPLEFAPGEEPTAFFYGRVAKEGETPTHTFDGVDYVGAILPPLPEWDKTVYPYALITEVVQGERYHFVAFSTKPMAHPDNIMPEYIWYGTQPTDDGATIEYICRTTDNDGWVFKHDSSYFRDPLFNLRWANHDALNTDGTIYLSAIDPIPIYE